MRLFQRGVLPPVNFLELDATLRSSILGPSGTRLVLPADLDPTLISTGSFTPAWTGFSANPVGDLRWIKFGGIVVLSIDNLISLLGTSNLATMTVTNLPAAIIPTDTQMNVCNIIDNAVELIGKCIISVSGTLSWGVGNTATVANRVAMATGGFTAAGTKGLFGDWCVTYRQP